MIGPASPSKRPADRHMAVRAKSYPEPFSLAGSEVCTD